MFVVYQCWSTILDKARYTIANISAKLPSHDIPIFLRLIDDLFMGLAVNSKVDDTLNAKVIRVAKEQGLQYDEMFVNKTCIFQVLLEEEFLLCYWVQPDVARLPFGRPSKPHITWKSWRKFVLSKQLIQKCSPETNYMAT